VNEDSKGKEHPVVFTDEIHDNRSLHNVAHESMTQIVTFVEEFKQRCQLRYD